METPVMNMVAAWHHAQNENANAHEVAGTRYSYVGLPVMAYPLMERSPRAAERKRGGLLVAVCLFCGLGICLLCQLRHSGHPPTNSEQRLFADMANDSRNEMRPQAEATTAGFPHTTAGQGTAAEFSHVLSKTNGFSTTGQTGATAAGFAHTTTTTENYLAHTTIGQAEATTAGFPHTMAGRATTSEFVHVTSNAVGFSTNGQAEATTAGFPHTTVGQATTTEFALVASKTIGFSTTSQAEATTAGFPPTTAVQGTTAESAHVTSNTSDFSTTDLVTTCLYYGMPMDNIYNLPNQPISGTLSECIQQCRDNAQCAAFSWPVGVYPGTQQDCYLKTTWLKSAANRDQPWITVVVNCSQAAPKITVTFSPGKLGLDGFWDTGRITGVHEGSQGKKRRVRPGMVMTMIDWQPYSEQMLEEKISGMAEYEIEFTFQASIWAVIIYGSVYFKVSGDPSDTVQFVYRLYSARQWTVFPEPAEYHDGVWTSSSWTPNLGDYDIRAVVNGETVGITDENLALSEARLLQQLHAPDLSWQRYAWQAFPWQREPWQDHPWQREPWQDYPWQRDPGQERPPTPSAPLALASIGVCYIADCGCPPFTQTWCTTTTSDPAWNWCSKSQDNCHLCTGKWCQVGTTGPTAV